MVRLLIADDSKVVRDYLAYSLARDPELQVVGSARDGEEALILSARLRPDVILMDVHMPRMNGYEASRRIMTEVPTPIVIMSATQLPGETSLAIEALNAGALTVAEKLPAMDHPDFERSVRHLALTIKLMAEVKVVKRWGSPKEVRLPRPAPVRSHRPIKIIAIGTSTGGPAILAQIFKELGVGCPVPILVTQHISRGFTQGLVSWLIDHTKLPISLPRMGQIAEPGSVYFAPEEMHMGISKYGRIVLSRERAEDGFCPSVSYLFRSVAESYGAMAMGIVLTGMGRDGVSGLKQLHDAGGITIAQDESSSVIFGMPGEAIRAGAAQYVLSPNNIVAMIRGVAP